MKAFLLAAGLGTRLRPLTNTIPKCLVPIGGKPLMTYWLELFEKHGINEVLINLHHLPEKVRELVNSYSSPLTVKMFYEPTLLGSAGTLWANRKWVSGEKLFFIAYGDNLTNANFTQIIEFHQKESSLLTMVVFKTFHPKECGIVTLDDQNTIIEFVEKPANPTSNLANAGLFVASPKIFNYFPKRWERSLDFGVHILPRLVGKMKAYVLTDYLQDIGTSERYQKAQIDVQTLEF